MRVWNAPVAAIVAMFVAILLAAQASALEPRTVAFLGVHFQNDNETYEPTSHAERNRLTKVEQIFKASVGQSGHYRFAEISGNLKEKIAAGQPPGECGGCEIEYGKELGTEQVAWVSVQKVSNLILNLNVYMADVASNKMIFVRSVDIRGNSDESWERSIKYLLKNYLLPHIS